MGLLVLRGASLEAAARITHACFDKTGTLTSGRMRLVGVEPAPGVGEAQLREAAAIAEDGLDHPIAKALQIHSLSSTDWSRRVVPGEGVIATRGPETIVAGTLPFVCPERAPAVTPETDRGTTIAVARSDRFLGVLTVGDELRTGARPLVEALRRAGVTSLVLTGDASSYANVILAPLAIDVHARLKPEQKQAIIKGIRDARPGSHVLFVGDGINDAPALASADVSIAMASGTDVARAAGDVIVLHDDIASVATFLSLSRATVRTMRRNLAWAVVYNALALPVAAGLFENFGIAMTPTIAGAAMAASSLGVLAQSLALRFVRLDAPRSTPNTSTRPSDAPAGCAASPHPPRAES